MDRITLCDAVCLSRSIIDRQGLKQVYGLSGLQLNLWRRGHYQIGSLLVDFEQSQRQHGPTRPCYSSTHFLPTLAQGFRNSTRSTQRHSVPSFPAAWAYSFLCRFISAQSTHRFGSSSSHCHLDQLASEYLSTTTSSRAVCLVAMGLPGALPIVLCWQTMDLQGHMERSKGSTWINEFLNLGNVVAPIFSQSIDTPHHSKFYTMLSARSKSVVASSTIAHTGTRRIATD